MVIILEITKILTYHFFLRQETPGKTIIHEIGEQKQQNGTHWKYVALLFLQVSFEQHFQNIFQS